METGSLLSEALRYMQQVRQNEQQLPFDLFNGSGGSSIGPGTGTGTGNEIEHGVAARGMDGSGNVNTLILSLHSIDEPFHILYNDDKSVNTDTDERRKIQKQLHRQLASIHSIIHTDLLPKYQKQYSHVWFAGGQGLSFGLHCNNNISTNTSTSEDQDGGAIPHLRATVRYGPHPIDEYHAIAIMMKLSHDLNHQYQIHTATSCWDVDDGHILLIEGSSSSSSSSSLPGDSNFDGLPSWVDDVIGVQGMNNRVYIVNGQIQLLDPSVKGLAYRDTDHDHNNHNHKNLHSFAGFSASSNYHLTKKESLFALQSKNGNNNYQCNGEELKLNSIIQERFRPFIQVLRSTSGSSQQEHQHHHQHQQKHQQHLIKQRRQLLKDHIHTAAIVLPLQIALLIKQRSDLVPCAILQFCSVAPLQQKKKKKKKNQQQPLPPPQSPPINDSDNKNEGYEIQFENLVITTITLPKSLYAMLLTCAGQIQPPMKIPKQFKSVELNRMKRKSLLGGEGYSHFRNSIEIGIRLTLGFQWVINGGDTNIDERGGTSSISGNYEQKTPTGTSLVSSTSSPFDRVLYHCRIDKEACLGQGETTPAHDAQWIEEAWKAGPNSTSEENDLSAIIKCPVWNPEIIKGGICPLTHPGMSASTHINNTLRKIEKQEDLSSTEISMMFPFPELDDVDSDSWIDLNSIDDLEAKMSEMTGMPSKQQQTNTNINSQKINEEEESMDLSEMKNMINGLESFVKNKSEIEGVSSLSATTKKTTVPPAMKSMDKNLDPVDISPKVFLTMLHKVLKSGPEDRFDDIIDPTSAAFSANKNDDVDSDTNRELLQYFTKEDLDIVDEMGDESDQEEDENIQQISQYEKERNEGTSMQDIMRAMDAELAGEDLDRSFKVPTNSDNDGDDNKNTDTNTTKKELPYDDPTAIQANVISNLLESLDAQNGKQGPVTTILNEMGIKAPGDME